MPTLWTPEVAAFCAGLITETIGWLVGAANDRGLGSGITMLPDEDAYDPAT